MLLIFLQTQIYEFMLEGFIGFTLQTYTTINLIIVNELLMGYNALYIIDNQILTHCQY